MTKADFGYGTMIADFPQRVEESELAFQHGDFKGLPYGLGSISDLLQNKTIVIGALVVLVVIGMIMSRKKEGI